MTASLALDKERDPTAERASHTAIAQLGKGGDVANSDLEAICRILSLWLRCNGNLDLALRHRQLSQPRNELPHPCSGADHELVSLVRAPLGLDHDADVRPWVQAAAAVGADGIIVEVHSQPDEAICDGPQQLRTDGFADYAARVRAAAAP